MIDHIVPPKCPAMLAIHESTLVFVDSDSGLVDVCDLRALGALTQQFEVSHGSGEAEPPGSSDAQLTLYTVVLD